MLIDRCQHHAHPLLRVVVVKPFLHENRLEIGGGTPEAFQSVIQTEVERIQKLIKSGALTAQ